MYVVVKKTLPIFPLCGDTLEIKRDSSEEPRIYVVWRISMRVPDEGYTAELYSLEAIKEEKTREEYRSVFIRIRIVPSFGWTLYQESKYWKIDPMVDVKILNSPLRNLSKEREYQRGITLEDCFSEGKKFGYFYPIIIPGFGMWRTRIGDRLVDLRGIGIKTYRASISSLYDLTGPFPVTKDDITFLYALTVSYKFHDVRGDGDILFQDYQEIARSIGPREELSSESKLFQIP